MPYFTVKAKFAIEGCPVKIKLRQLFLEKNIEKKR